MYGKIKIFTTLVAILVASTLPAINVNAATQRIITIDQPIDVYVAVYNVSQIKKNNGIGGVYNWKNSVTYGMIAALENKEFVLNGKTYRFKTTIVNYQKIVDGILNEKLSNGELKYKLFVAPGDYDYIVGK